MAELTYGTAWLDGRWWVIRCDPHVRIRLKRVFGKISRESYDTIRLVDTPETCRELLWFSERFPLGISPLAHMEAEAARHREDEQRIFDVLNGHVPPAEFDLALPLRPYQQVAADMALMTGGLLVGDDVGLGKTAVGIAMFSKPHCLPALVVAPTHLQRQWQREIHRFAPQLTTHIVKKTAPYEIKGDAPDVLLVTYHKLHGWAALLAERIRCVVFDEVHELRRGLESRKGRAARDVAVAAAYRLGLTATPIYNYGGEMFNIMETLRPGALGAESEFENEWGAWDGSIKEPKAFGAYLRRNGLMLRRTREEVGRDLAPIIKSVSWIDADLSLLDEMASSADALALAIVQGRAGTKQEREERWATEREFDNLLRQITGVAKAPLVAELVRMLVEKGEQVVVYAWHREVYSLLLDRLAEYRPAMYTGTESPAKKEKQLQRFYEHDARVLLISLRSGAGLHGLQYHSRTVVFAELDWSPAQHEQCEGRVRRDGQLDQVTAYYPVATDGSDPFVAKLLGLKRAQLEGIRDPDGAAVPHHDATGRKIGELARAYLEQRRGAVTPASPSEPPLGHAEVTDGDDIFQVAIHPAPQTEPATAEQASALPQTEMF
jgi:SNF2 family DNA or RNA helicase